MSDRLQELLRQRAAIQAHLVWLDHEIAQTRPADIIATTARIAPVPAPDSAPTPTPLVYTPTTVANPLDPEAILAGYRQDTQNLRPNLRKGCLLYFFAAFVLLGLGVVSFYFVNRLIRQHSSSAPSEQRAASPVER